MPNIVNNIVKCNYWICKVQSPLFKTLKIISSMKTLKIIIFNEDTNEIYKNDTKEIIKEDTIEIFNEDTKDNIFNEDPNEILKEDTNEIIKKDTIEIFNELRS